MRARSLALKPFRRRVLQVIACGESVDMRIDRILHPTRSRLRGVKQAVGKLVEMGLITKSRDGRLRITGFGEDELRHR